MVKKAESFLTFFAFFRSDFLVRELLSYERAGTTVVLVLLLAHTW